MPSMPTIARPLATRASSILRYLSWVPAPWQWRLYRHHCSACGANRWFVSFNGTGAFMTRCLGCRANLPPLATNEVVRRHFGGDYTGRRAYELSSYGATFRFLQREFQDFTFSEYMPGKPFGRTYDGIRNEDVQDLRFTADNTYDVITSNGVLEHVPDDIRGFRECLRVLRPGGALIFTVPLYDTNETIRWASKALNGEILWRGKPEHHDSRLGGAYSAPVFWHHSKADICERVRSVGFDSVTLEQVALCGGIVKAVVYGRKRD